MSDLRQYVSERLEALEQLEREATPGERARYAVVRGELQAMLTPPEGPPGTAAQRLNRLHQNWQRMEREAQDATLGPYWQAWASDRAGQLGARYARALEQHQYDHPGEAFTPAAVDQVAQALGEQVDDASLRVEELSILAALERTWAERHASLDAVDTLGRDQQLEWAKAEVARLAEQRKRPPG